MPHYPINNHAKIAEVAANNGWRPRPVSVTGEGKVITRTHYYRDNDEIMIKYDFCDKMVEAVIVNDEGNPDSKGSLMFRVATVIKFLERVRTNRPEPVDEWPVIVNVSEREIHAQRQDGCWRTTGKATRAHRTWDIYDGMGRSVATVDSARLPEGKDIEAVKALLRALF